ncbi:pantoate--beta-alanine ligase [Pseudomonas typographi]|uniref:Pantothenate synthetase n=1 Tax=Pseudomonas typographi TaxID=2715964 RepID=A0ABR7Z6C6_9PSED|nr:pantoate--beta-alanine ligase [Pseudomonas typographi]MBD1553747.1 pantoate--beta-alanine ligase [Pseudomonas typographi]MBD1589192.1 pantoate--beta-alanine ligase [Pseudomonas typographi]MBD1601033.1 pantoate--beta-alanine ligase [Pseudomonas typographi]
MNTVNSVRELRAAVARARNEGKRIGFVPTMGNLHAGHIALVTKAQQRADFVVASIFVNPLQFGPHEDLDSYPRTLAADQEKLVQAGCNLLFAPSVSEMYPAGTAVQTRVSVPELAQELCGASRPGHFDGVATVVCKLFNVVQPDLAVFGQKDYQQLAVLRAMVRDLNMPIQIIGEATVRAEDGLALSSRNSYLNAEQRALAPLLQQTLQRMASAILAGERHYEALMTRHRQAIAASGLRLDYLDIREATTLHPATVGDSLVVILVAAYAGTTRLIDNLTLDLAAATDKPQ